MPALARKRDSGRNMGKGSFTTDHQGNLPLGTRLLPDTTYIAMPPDRKVAPRLRNHQELADWVEDCVLGDLRTLKLGIDAWLSENANQNVSRGGGGNFLLVAGCLMALEFIARIYAGKKQAPQCVQEYATDFLAPINPRYVEACGILWRAARNGMLHASWPLRVCAQGNPTEFRFGIGNELTDSHLALEDDSIKISGPRLLNDLEMSVANGFGKWLRSSTDAAVLDRGQPHMLELTRDNRQAMKEFALIMRWGCSHDSG
jgi:hypothetical protein